MKKQIRQMDEKLLFLCFVSQKRATRERGVKTETEKNGRNTRVKLREVNVGDLCLSTIFITEWRPVAEGRFV